MALVLKNIVIIIVIIIIIIIIINDVFFLRIFYWSFVRSFL